MFNEIGRQNQISIYVRFKCIYKEKKLGEFGVKWNKDKQLNNLRVKDIC